MGSSLAAELEELEYYDLLKAVGLQENTMSLVFNYLYDLTRQADFSAVTTLFSAAKKDQDTSTRSQLC